MKFVKMKAKELGISLIPVNHCVAHLEIGETVGAKDPVMLYASGANTQIIAYEAGKYRVFGETLDLGVGNFIDTIARYMGLGFPGGPKIQKMAEEVSNKENLIELPYSIKGMDVAFSGLQTKLKTLIDKGRDKNMLAYSMQEVVFAMLVEAAERALAHTGKKELLLGGGVACNFRLQEMCKIMCEERGVKYFCPERSLLVDNAAMIGYLGLKMFKAGLGVMDLEKIDIAPRERTDEVICDLWR
jgi:N6-L-threonylcarbamoyladenine synthase